MGEGVGGGCRVAVEEGVHEWVKLVAIGMSG